MGEKSGRRTAFGQYKTHLQGFRDTFSSVILEAWPDAVQVSSPSTYREDPWYEMSRDGKVLRFGIVSNFYSGALSMQVDGPTGTRGVESRQAHLPWGIARTMFVLSDDTRRMRDGRSRVDWFFADEKTRALLTNDAQLEFATTQILPRWMAGIESAWNRL